MSDYASIKAQCLNTNKLWEDPDFPPVMSSLFYHQIPPFNFEWKRPKEILIRPTFSSTKFYEIVPGKLGDSWLVMAMDVLQTYGGLFSRTVPLEQSMDEEYAGIFRFNIWVNGQWTEVLVDDRLPTVNGKLVFIQTQKAQVLWPALLEKAYAKVFRSYEAMKYGNYSDGLADLTGGVGQTLKTAEVTKRDLKKYLDQTIIITAIYNEDYMPPVLGLNNGVYKVCHLIEVSTPKGPVHLVQLRKPTITADAVPPRRLIRNPEDWLHIHIILDEPYCTWVLYSDYCSLFPKTELLHLDQKTSAVEPCLQLNKKWILKSCQGSWVKGISAGGCKNETHYYFHTNRQILVNINGLHKIIICLFQHKIIDPKTIGFSIYKADNLETGLAPKSFFKKNKSLFNTDFTNARRICYRWLAFPGSYLIIPSTFDPNEEADFTLYIFSTQLIGMRLLDDTLSVGQPLKRGAPNWPVTEAFAFYESTFLDVADELKTVNVFEMEEVLETCLPNDYIKSCCSIETCRQIMLTMARDSERLTVSEFKDFMCNLQVWSLVFKKHFRERIGVLKAESLRETIADIGFTLPEKVLSILILRFMKKDCVLRFCDFICIILYLYRIVDIHGINNLDPQGGDAAERLRLMFRS